MSALEFSQQLRADLAASAAFAETVVKKIGLEALTGVTSLTPVDTGRLRAGWMVSLNGPSEEAPADGSYSGADIARAIGEIENFKLGDEIYVVDNVEYGIFVNDGTEHMAPHHMVELTVDRLSRAYADVRL